MEDILTTLKVTISSRVLYTAFITIVALILSHIILAGFTKLLDSSKKMDKTIANFLKPLVRFIVYFFVCLFVASSLGINTSSIVALASVLSAAIALAAQNVLSNLFGGITMLATRPFNVGDYISAGGSEGVVLEIGMFYTVLITVDSKRITIPNGTISSTTITNFSSEGKRRVDVVVTTSYDCKMDDVKASLQHAINKTSNVLDGEPFIRVSNYGPSSISYTIRVWTKTVNYWDVYFDLLENVKRSFDEDGIQMTYDHIIVHNADK